MINPYTRSDRSIASDLKIFIGKRSEISQLEVQNKIVDKKWYLAWDTGEFFVANSLRKLVRYGGTANNLSKEDIDKMIDSYTADELEFIRKQLTDALKNYNEIKQLVSNLENKVNLSLQKLENETIQYIIKKIDEVIANGDTFTYSKKQIDDKDNAIQSHVLNYVSNNFISQSKLSAYATKEYVDNNIDTRIAYDTGDSILKYLSMKINGLFFCISDSSNGNFEVGHTYQLLNGLSNDLTAAGTGGGYITPNITLTVNGKSKIIQEICSSYNDNKVFNYTLSNPKDIKGNLSFYENKNKINSISEKPNISGSFEYHTTLVNLNVGEYTYTLSGEDKKGNPIKGDFILKIIAPIYYGSTKNIVPNSDIILSSNKVLTDIVANKYTFATKNEEYIFIAVPDNLKITKVSMQGFEIPMNPAEKVNIHFGNYIITYNYYSSKTPAETGVLNVDIL